MPTKKPAAKHLKSKTAAKATTKASGLKKGARRAAIAQAVAQAGKPNGTNTVQTDKQLEAVRPKLPSVWKITSSSLAVLWKHKGLFLGITLIYALLNILLVRSLSSSSDIANLKDLMETSLGAGFIGIALIGTLSASSASSSSPAAGTYQVLLTLLISLVIVWSLRRVLAGDKVRIRDGFYEGIYPLVPVVLVLLVCVVQLLPVLIGASLYAAIVTTGIATTGIEQVLWSLVLFGGALASLYLLCSSVFALYVATLPHMTPWQALRSARGLVKHRRWVVMRKLLFLPLAVVLVTAVIMLPFVLWLTPAAPYVLFVLTILSVTAIHSYMYMLYRELLA